MVTLEALHYKIHFHPLEVVSPAIHNSKWVKIIHDCLILDQTFANLCLNTNSVPNRIDLTG